MDGGGDKTHPFEPREQRVLVEKRRQGTGKGVGETTTASLVRSVSPKAQDSMH